MRPKVILTDNQINELKHLVLTGEYTTTEIGVKMNIPVYVIYRIIKELDIVNRNKWRKWTKDDEKWLIENFSDNNTDYCASFLNTSGCGLIRMF